MLSYYFAHILNFHGGEQPIWCVAMSAFTVCLFAAFLSFAHDVPVVSEGSSALPPVWVPEISVSFLSGVCWAWRRCAFCQLCSTLVPTCPWGTSPIVVVAMSIGRRVRRHGFLIISGEVKCPR